MKKRFVFLFLTILAAVCVMAGVASCGDSDTSENKNQSGIEEPSNEEKVDIVEDEVHNGLFFEEHNKSYGVAGVSGSFDSDLIIPSEYNGLPVTSIEDYAFIDKKSIISVYIPNTVTYIGEYAFYGCTSLKSVTISENLMGIGSHSFYNCTSLSGITIPESVTSLGNYAFYNCTAINNIGFNARNLGDLSSSNYLFYNAGTKSGGISVNIGNNVTKIPAYLFDSYNSIYAPNITWVVFKDGSKCTSIGNYAFAYCKNLTSINIPDAVVSIGSYAFRGCSSLLSIEIPGGVTSISSYLFYECTSLKCVNIPQRITSIGTYAFYNCRSLEEIYFDAIALSDLSSGNYVFYNAGQDGTGITITIGKGVTKIPAYLFYTSSSSNTPKITILLFEEVSNCENIGAYSFYYCRELKSLTIGSAVKSIGSFAFTNCTGIEEIYFNAVAMNNLTSNNYVFQSTGLGGNGITVSIGAEVTRIPAYLFCPNNTSSYLPKITRLVFEQSSQCTSLGNYAFYGATFLEEIYFDAVEMDDLLSSNYVFYNAGQDCAGLTLTIGANVTKIPAYLFYPYSSSSHAPKLTSVIFEDDCVCQSIGASAFEYCSGFAEILLPDSVTSIGDSAFYGCSSLVNVKMPCDLISIGSCAFYCCTSLLAITFPDSVTTIGDHAFSGCTDLSDIIIPDGVTKIGNYAFYGCTSLTSIIIPDTVISGINNTFYNCKALKEIVIGKGVTSISKGSFYGCSSLESITIPFVGGSAGATSASSSTLFGYIFGSSNYTGAISTRQYYSEYGSSTYYIPTSLVSVTIGGGLICYGAFYGCTMIKNITLGDITKIQSYAFYNCSALTYINIPDSVTDIGSRLLYGCTSLESASISNNVTSIQQYTFYNCTSLKNVTIGESVTNIIQFAFGNCKSLTSITIPKSVNSISSQAFIYCYKLIEVYNLSSLNIVAGNTGHGHVGYYAKNIYSEDMGQSYLYVTDEGYEFYDDGDVIYLMSYIGTESELILPVLEDEREYEIYQYAFDGLSIKSIVIPQTVTSIGDGAFYDCTLLEEIYFDAVALNDFSPYNYVFYNTGRDSDGIALIIGKDVTKIPAYLFHTLSTSNAFIVSLQFEDGSQCESIGDYAFYNCVDLVTVIIPRSVVNVGDYAFSGCESIACVYYLGNSEDWCEIIIGIDNDFLTSASIYYYSESEPDEDGKYWVYSDGEIVIWKKID